MPGYVVCHLNFLMTKLKLQTLMDSNLGRTYIVGFVVSMHSDKKEAEKDSAANWRKR